MYIDLFGMTTAAMVLLSAEVQNLTLQKEMEDGHESLSMIFFHTKALAAPTFLVLMVVGRGCRLGIPKEHQLGMGRIQHITISFLVLNIYFLW